MPGLIAALCGSARLGTTYLEHRLGQRGEKRGRKKESEKMKGKAATSNLAHHLLLIQKRTR